MKETKEDKMLRDLFRQKLENAEIIPSPSVSKKLMSRLGRREFLRFNPARFNIWYTGAIAVAGAALALILTSGLFDAEKPASVNNPDVPVSEIVIDKNISTSQPELRNKDDNKKPLRKLEQKKSGKSINLNVKNDNLNARIEENTISTPSGVVSSMPEAGLFHNADNQRNKLQPGTKLTEILFQSSVKEGCPPLRVKFRKTDNYSDSCRWSFGDGGYSTLKDPEWLFDLPGEYHVMLQVFNKNGTILVSSEIITVHPRPVARFEITPEGAVLPEDEIIFHNFSSDAVRYIWDFGDGNYSEQFEPRHKYSKFGKYNVSLVAVSESGCTDSIIVSNAFSGSGYFIDFPNAFIPNTNGPSSGYYSPKSDEGAQVFHPVFTGISNYQLRIFSRIGILLFESNDINIGWDGYFKGQLLDPGVYIWKVRGNFVNGEPFTKMGDVTLLKN